MRLSQVAAEPALAQRRRGGVWGRRGFSWRWWLRTWLRGGCAHEAVVVGRSVQVGGALLGGDGVELVMHGLTSCWVAVRAL
jgi:hypothetical protein